MLEEFSESPWSKILVFQAHRLKHSRTRLTFDGHQSGIVAQAGLPPQLSHILLIFSRYL
jgi:hypothetical protein